jgi:hypothetical protein
MRCTTSMIGVSAATRSTIAATANASAAVWTTWCVSSVKLIRAFAMSNSISEVVPLLIA